MALQSRSILAVSSWMVFVIALGFQSRVTAKRQAVQRLTPEESIRLLHHGIEHALADLTMTNLREMHGTDANGKPTTYKVAPTFGISRVPTIMLTHNGVLRDSKVPMFFDNVEFYAVSCAGKPIDTKAMKLHTNFGVYGMVAKAPLKNAVISFAAKSVRQLQTDAVYRGKVDGCEAQARALKLSKPECLSCHPGMKVGDPAGYVVYIVRPAGKSG